MHLRKHALALAVALAAAAMLSGRANAYTLFGDGSGTATAQFHIPTSLDPSSLTITSINVLYSNYVDTSGKSQPITGGTLLNTGSNNNYGLQILDGVTGPGNLTQPIRALQICFSYGGSISLDPVSDPNIPNPLTGKPYVPWSITGKIVNGQECFTMTQVPGSADLDSNAFYALFQAQSNDPTFATAPVTIQAIPPPAAPEASTWLGLAGMLAMGGICSKRYRRRQASC